MQQAKKINALCHHCRKLWLWGSCIACGEQHVYAVVDLGARTTCPSPNPSVRKNKTKFNTLGHWICINIYIYVYVCVLVAYLHYSVLLSNTIWCQKKYIYIYSHNTFLMCVADHLGQNLKPLGNNKSTDCRKVRVSQPYRGTHISTSATPGKKMFLVSSESLATP